jgi:hypothetical protein
MQSVPIITNVVSLHPANGKVYSIQHYVIKFVSDLQQVGNICILNQVKKEKQSMSTMENYLSENTNYYDVINV